MIKIVLWALLFGLWITPAGAQDQPKGPMNISADQALEWRREASQYIARGNAVVTQDDMTLKADEIVADYRDGPGGGSPQIYRLTATGKVVIKTLTETATGSKAVYERDQNQATLDGPVTITRGTDVLNGARAVMDLTTKTSTLLGDPEKGGRVTGVFQTQGKEGLKP